MKIEKIIPINFKCKQCQLELEAISVLIRSLKDEDDVLNIQIFRNSDSKDLHIKVKKLHIPIKLTTKN